MAGAFKCPGCGRTTSGELDYCPQCGERLTRRCPTCNAQWRYIFDQDYRFCPACGTRIEPVGLGR